MPLSNQVFVRSEVHGLEAIIRSGSGMLFKFCWLECGASNR